MSLSCLILGSKSYLLMWDPPKHVSEDAITYRISYLSKTLFSNQPKIKLTQLRTNRNTNGLEVTILAETRDGSIPGIKEVVTCEKGFEIEPQIPDFDFTIMHSSSDLMKANVLIKWKPHLVKTKNGSKVGTSV